jgi:hypothetical protein
MSPSLRGSVDVWAALGRHSPRLIINNVPPRLRDGGTRVRGDAQGGCVEVPPNFRDFWEMGDRGMSHI